MKKRQDNCDRSQKGRPTGVRMVQEDRCEDTVLELRLGRATFQAERASAEALR